MVCAQLPNLECGNVIERFHSFPRDQTWAYGKEKIRGAERNLPDFFGLCPSCQKKLFPKLLSGGGGEGVITKNSY